MKILYGVQGTGNGHISRCRIMAKYFSEQNIDVTFLISGRSKSKLFEMDCFGDFIHKRGLTFSTSNGKIDYKSTIFNNNIFKFLYDIYTLDVNKYDLVITDFEPITAWAAKLRNKRSIAIGHQYAFGKNTPVSNKSSIAQFILKNFAPANMEIGLHWSKYSYNVMPPIIDVNLQRTSNQDYILVYLPFENQENVLKLLKQLTEQKFVVYSPELEDTELDNIILRKTSYTGFKKHLTGCSGVICNSGFELNSECIHLNLPILTKPIHGQMEQESNALALSQLQLGTVMPSLNLDDISHWLKGVKVSSNNKYPDVAKELVNWVLLGAREKPEKIADKLWSYIENKH